MVRSSLQVPVLSHDPAGPAGSNGLDTGHPAGWEDLHLRLQCECRPYTLLRYSQVHSISYVDVHILNVRLSTVLVCLMSVASFLRFAQQHRPGCDQSHGQSAVQGGRHLQE